MVENLVFIQELGGMDITRVQINLSVVDGQKIVIKDVSSEMEIVGLPEIVSWIENQVKAGKRVVFEKIYARSWRLLQTQGNLPITWVESKKMH